MVSNHLNYQIFFQVSLIKEDTNASNIFSEIKNYKRPVKEEPKTNSYTTKNIELPPIVTASDLIQAQTQSKVPEPKIKRGIKRDHLTQQSIKSFISPTSVTTVPENEECLTKKPKIRNTDSDMEISSDDEVQIIDESDLSCPPKIQESHLQERKNNTSNFDCKFKEATYYQNPSGSIQMPKIITASSLLKINSESCSTFDSSKNSLSVDSEDVVIVNEPPSHQDVRIIHTHNNKSTNCINYVSNQENGLLLNQSMNSKPQTSEKSEKDIFKEVDEILLSPSEHGKVFIVTQNEHFLNQNQKDLKRPLVKNTLSVQQHTELSSSKINMNSLFGENSDDESKTTLNDVKKKSLGVRLGTSSNVNTTLKTNKKLLEPIKTIKSKTEDPNNKQKKFELSNLVVKLLNPYYKNNIFKTKELFKFMAREIVHKILESMSNPGKLILIYYIRVM